MVEKAPSELRNDREPRRLPRLVGWQGFTVRVPDGWDLTGFSGTDQSGYLRIDDSAEQGIEIKWETESKGAKNPPDVSVRRESYFRILRETAKKKRLDLVLKDSDAPRGAVRDDRTTAGFNWIGDRRALGVVWYCQTCRRVVIAQVLGSRGGKGGLSTLADGILGSLRCHDDEAGWRVWALYDLVTKVPAEYGLQSQQLMNIYLRLQFAHKTTRLSIEQWAVANVARRDAYLDKWLAANSKGEIADARYTVAEGEMHGHGSIVLGGGLGIGQPMAQAVRELTQLQRPATRYNGIAWHCEPSNKIYAVQTLRAGNVDDLTEPIALRTRCHDGETA